MLRHSTSQLFHLVVASARYLKQVLRLFHSAAKLIIRMMRKMIAHMVCPFWCARLQQDAVFVRAPPSVVSARPNAQFKLYEGSPAEKSWPLYHGETTTGRQDCHVYCQDPKESDCMLTSLRWRCAAASFTEIIKALGTVLLFTNCELHR